MKLKFLNIFFLIIFVYFSNFVISNAEIIKKIEISGNDRISDDTIILFSEISINDDLNENELNLILKRLFETDFFKNINLSFNNNLLLINVEENPII